MISVPVPPENVLDTVQQLPRTPREAGVVPVQLKRKMKYDRNHKKEYINPDKIFLHLGYFKRLRNPYYQFFDDVNSYQERCSKEDEQGHQFLFGEAGREQDDDLGIGDNEELDSEEQEQEDENEISKNTISINSNVNKVFH